MKRTVFALIMILICVSVCLLSDSYVEKYTKELMTILYQTENYLKEDNFDKAYETITESDEKWERSEVLFGSLSESLLIENMDLYFNSLPLYIKHKKKEDALIIILQCKTTLEEIRRWQKVNLKNIF